MRKLPIFSTLLLAVLASATASADTLAGRFGLTGKVGGAVPLEERFVKGSSGSSAGFIGGGGAICGIGDHLALEIEALHMPQLDIEVAGAKAFEASVTDISLGLQLRPFPLSRLVPYLGIGPDFIHGNLDHVSGAGYKLDWSFGGHANLGMDWFVTRGIVLTAEVRGVYATDGDVKSGPVKVSEYRPHWFQGTVGVRLILPSAL